VKRYKKNGKMNNYFFIAVELPKPLSLEAKNNWWFEQ